jgi:multidrug efflux pump subunit AcrA (membrane-fusion protein)
LSGPSVDEQLSIDSAQLGLEEAQRRVAELGMAKPGETAEPVDPLDRRRADLDLRRAEIDLQRAQEAQAERIVDAQGNLVTAQEGLTSAQDAAVTAALTARDAQQAVVEAELRQDEAGRAAEKAVRDLKKAHEDSLQAAIDAADKQQAYADALLNSDGNTKGLIANLKAVKDLYPEIATEIDKYITKLEIVGRRLPNLWDEAKRLGIGGLGVLTTAALQAEVDKAHAEGRAFGGSVVKRNPYEVTERGLPELYAAGGKQFLVPAMSGRIIPLKPVIDQPSAAGGSSFQTGDIIVNTTHPGEPTAFAMRRELRKESFLAGRR